MAPHSSTLAWKIPWREEPGRLQSMGSRRVGHDWATSLSLFTFMHWQVAELVAQLSEISVRGLSSPFAELSWDLQVRRGKVGVGRDQGGEREDLRPGQRAPLSARWAPLCQMETMFLPPGEQEAHLGKQRAGWVLVPCPTHSWMPLCRPICIISLAVAGND